MNTFCRRIAFVACAVLLLLTTVAAQNQSGGELKRFTQPFDVRSIAVSPDGQTFLTAGDRIVLWNLETGAEIRRFNRETSGVRFLPNGTQFVSVHDNDIHLWDIATGRDLGAVEAENRVVGLWPSADSQRLLAYSVRELASFLARFTEGAVQVWDLASRREIAKVHERDVMTGALLPDGTAVYTIVDDDTLTSRRLETKAPVATFAAEGVFSDGFFRAGDDHSYMLFSPDGRRAISAHSANVRFWDAQTGTLLKDIATTKEWELEAGDGGSNIAFSPDSRLIAWTIRESRIVRLIDVETAREVRQFTHDRNVKALAFTPDGRLLLTGGEDKLVRLWDISTLAPTAPITTSMPPAPITPPATVSAPPTTTVVAANPPVAAAARAPAGVPRLSYVVRVEAANGGAILRGGEEFKIRVQVTNAGTASANDVRVRIAGDPAVLSAIQPVQTIAAIDTAQNQAVEFAGILPFDTEPRNAEIEVSLAIGNSILPDIQVIGLGLARGEVRRTRTVLSEVIDVDDVPTAIPMPERASSLAIVIGLGNYRESIIPKIPFAGRDADIMARYLENVAGIPKQNIRILLDDRATRTDIEEAIEEWLPRRVNANSTVIVYYAGHGALDPATGDAYLVPYEGHPDSPATRLYALRRLYERLESLGARDVTVFLDSCFSGGGRSLTVTGRPLIVSGPTIDIQSSTKLSVLAAAQGNQVSSDLERTRHGLFTYFLLKGIRGEADTNNDSWVDLQELYTFARTNVQATALSELNREQVPALTGGPDVQQRASNLRLFARPRN